MKSVAVIRVLNDAYITPPKPASPADSANRTSFVRSTDTPEAIAAAGADRTASIARPDGEPRSALSPAATTATRTTRATPSARSSDRSTGPNTGRGTDHPESPLRSHRNWNSTWSARNASASVARARDRPPSRSAGSATSAPSRAAAHVPTASAATNGQPRLISSPATSAAPVTNVAWASETIDPSPVTTVKDMNTSATASPWASSPLQNGVVTV